MKNKLIVLTAALLLIPGLSMPCYHLDEAAVPLNYLFEEGIVLSPYSYACISLEPLKEDHRYSIACHTSKDIDYSSISVKLSYGIGVFSYENSTIVSHDVRVNHHARLFYYDSIEIENNNEDPQNFYTEHFDFSVTCHATDLGVASLHPTKT